MTDRELLELAAKAAGIKVYEINDDGVWYEINDPDPIVYECVACWNPLTNDGAALRLAVKLWMQIDPTPIHGCVVAQAQKFSVFIYEHVVDCDPYAAARRAIVRAAAEIGRSME